MTAHDTLAPDPGEVDHLFRVTEALTYIENYKNSATKVPQYSFVFKTQELLDYLQARGNSIVNFVVGQNANEDSLFLFLASVDDSGKNEYLSRNDTCFLLAGTNFVNIPTTLEQQSSNVIDTFFIEAMNVTDAQSMIDYYQQSSAIRNKNNGWLYNANDLAGYLHAGINAGGMEYTQFILAMDGNNIIHLVIVGSNDGTNHMYMGYRGQSCVMENTTPCPQCNTVSGGTTFDPPICTY
ncbi:hypothetical protein GCM10023093_03350 [Nemorincola caseinilytica]|uniref:Uncharacterized protein n=2 Tax=Nemorincola caseinilytica TaxID=2054315 RepID=A0ABP8N373_9BACT